MRDPPPRTGSAPSPILLVILAVALLAGALHWLTPSHGHAGAVVVRPLGLPHTPGFTVGVPQSPYAKNDPWAAWLAPESVCPGGEDASRSAAVQEAVATCLLNYARGKEGLPPLPRSGPLDVGSSQKAWDIHACNDFDHYACGKPPDADARSVGLTDRAFGENIYWGPQMYAPPRVAVDGWLNSEHHRENLFDPRWTAQGVAVLVVDSFRGSRGAIWVNEFSAP
jgi:uncharacterized protein YkwD